MAGSRQHPVQRRSAMSDTCALKPDCPQWGPRSTAEILARYDQPVPRYTSYPTAPHFHAGVGEADYRQWLDGLSDFEPASLYVHIPFCQELCWYCGCHTVVARRY